MKKPTYPTFEVTLWDAKGEEADTLIVRAAPFSKLQEVKDLQTKLIVDFEEKQGSLSELISDKSVFSTMKKLAGLLRVVGLEKPGFDISSLYDEGDIVQLGQIFFSESVNADMRSPGYSDVEIVEGQPMKLYNRPTHRQNPIPSAIARIHDLPFFDILMEIRLKREEETEAKTKTESKPKEESKAKAEKKKAINTKSDPVVTAA